MRHTSALFALAGLAALVHAQPSESTIRPDAPARQPAAEPEGEAPAGAAGEILTADDLLIALETADAGMSSLRTDLLWAQTFAIAGDMQMRWGTLTYWVEEPAGEGLPPRRAFAVEFNQKQVGERRPAPERIDYVFDGEWFLERIHEEHQAFKRQVVPPGQQADPLRIGEGPFPVPVGQKRDEILARFTAELIDPVGQVDPRLMQFVQRGAGTYALELVPHPDLVEDSTWRKIRIWYDKETLEPRLAWTINAAEDESYVQLLNVERDIEIDEAVFDTSDPGAGWETFITPWNAPAGG